MDLKRDRKAQKGSILILVLWVLLFLGLFSQAIGFAVRQRLDFTQRLDLRERLRDIAQSGIEKGISVLGEKAKTGVSADGLSDSWNRDESSFKEMPVGRGFFNVTVQDPQQKSSSMVYGLIDEERKINLNKVQSTAVLSRLIENAVSISEEQAMIIGASLIDFRDEDDHSFQEGAESHYYESLTPAYKAKDAPYDTEEELLFVKGMTPKIREGLEPYVTLHNSGWVNINTASGVVLKALGLTDKLAEKILEYRAGRDGQLATEDDVSIQDLAQMTAELNQVVTLDEVEQAGLQNLVQSGALSTYSEHFLIRSTGRVTGRQERLTRTCTVKRGGIILNCKDRYWTADKEISKPLKG